MSESPSILGPIVIGALVTAVPSVIPVVGLLNFTVPGLWFWAGGALTVAILVRRGAKPELTFGAVVGFLATALGAAFIVVFDIILSLTGASRAVTAWYYSFLPKSVVKIYDQVGVPLEPVEAVFGSEMIKFAVIALMIWMLAAASFGTLGGALGLRLGRKPSS